MHTGHAFLSLLQNNMGHDVRKCILAILSVFVVNMKILYILAIQNVASEDSDLTVRMILIFAGHTCPSFLRKNVHNTG